MSHMKNDVSLVVSSCDKYEDAWYPYFELIKKYWPSHPQKIYLISETKAYHDPQLDITTVNSRPQDDTWSKRLYHCLEQISTKYIVFSLEDFFLLDFVDEAQLEKCYQWMEETPDIAVCRLCSSPDQRLKKTDRYGDFYLADRTVGYRLDTQAALWNRETLMSFIDLSEDPWAFEGTGTERVKDTDKIFLWHHVDTLDKMDNRVFPYQIFQKYGYGIAWGKWLWNDKKWFEQNGIQGVRYNRLGILSERTVHFRFAHLYNKDKNLLDKMIFPFYRCIIKLQKIKQNISVFGLTKGLKISWKTR